MVPYRARFTDSEITAVRDKFAELSSNVPGLTMAVDGSLLKVGHGSETFFRFTLGDFSIELSPATYEWEPGTMVTLRHYGDGREVSFSKPASRVTPEQLLENCVNLVTDT